MFGAVGARDPLEAVSAGKTEPGIEHWLSLLHEQFADRSKPICLIGLCILTMNPAPPLLPAKSRYKISMIQIKLFSAKIRW